MTFKQYNHTNNAFCELLTDLQSSDATMMLTGNFNRLPTRNFIVKISKYQGTKCVARENIYVANRNNNICTGLIRAYEKAPMDDDATEWIQQALNFSAGDMVECVVSSEIIKDLQNNLDSVLKWNSTRVFNSYSVYFWVKFGTLKGEASRLNIKIMGGAWFGANNNSTTATNEIQLTIGNSDHERRCTWYWKNDFSASIVDKVRVKKISTDEWGIYAYISAWTSKCIVDIFYSGEFIEDFQQNISVENESGNSIYDIPKYNNDMNIGGLQEIVEPSNIYDFFPLKEYSGGNKKVALESLRKWILANPEKVTTSNIVTSSSSAGGEVPSVAIPKWGIWTFYLDKPYNDNALVIYHSTDNVNWKQLYYKYYDRVGIVVTLLLPAWFIKSSVSSGYSTRFHQTIQIF